MRHLLNHPSLAGILSVLVSVLVVKVSPNWVANFYAFNIGTMAGTAFTLLGFLVAAVTILLTLRDRPFLVALQRDRPTLWKQAVSEMFVTTNLLAVFGLTSMLFGGSIPSATDYPQYRELFLGCYVFLFTLSVFQIGKTISVLHGIAKF